MLMQAAKPLVLFVAVAFTTLSLAGCNNAPPPPPAASSDTKPSTDKAEKKPAKPKKGPANVTS